MVPELAPLVARIRSLLDPPALDPGEPLLTEMEHTLTDGYARALEIEAERLRLERRIGELAHRIEGPDQAGELRRLAERLRSSDDDLASLRELLVGLQRRVDAERAAAA
jgi:hypothetical protein